MKSRRLFHSDARDQKQQEKLLSQRPRRRRFWFVVGGLLLIGAGVAYMLYPKRSEMWWRICVRNQDQNNLKEASLTVSDALRQMLAQTKLGLTVSYDQNNRSELCGMEGWHNEMAEKILAASNDGVTVSINSPRCKPHEFKIRRHEIQSFYELPYFRLGGHGSGYHVAARHYRFSHSLDLDCEFANSSVDSTR